MELDASLSWLALALTPGLACRLCARLLRKIGSPDRIFHASLTELEGCSLPALVAQAIVKKGRVQARRKRTGGDSQHRRLPADQLDRAGISANAAANLRSAGALLSARRPANPEHALPQHRRHEAAHALRLTNGGTPGARSGRARPGDSQRAGAGVDAIGHQGALAANGRAIGVLGTGIDVCYPKENKKLYEKVLERGAILSEFPLGTHPAPENFPIRNRIVAGMPLGVIVIEGAEFSGSLITARLAMEFGREVFGVPGNVTQPVSFAPNLLIKQGAKLVVNAEDVIEELSTPVRAALLKVERPEAEQRNLLAAAALGASEKKLYELLNVEETRHIDELVENSGLNSSEVLATLFDLEMKGVVRQLPGKQFSKVML